MEVKKDEHELKKCTKRMDRFAKTSVVNSYEHREIMLYKSIQKILKSGGEVHVICSIEEAQNIIHQHASNI